MDGTGSSWVLIDRPGALLQMVEVLRAQRAVAVDTESNSFYAYYHRICLIQLSIPGTDYIVDPLAGLDLSPLGEIFADSRIQKVFHAAEQDIAGLWEDFGFQVTNLFDTMKAARILGWPHAGLADLLWEHFGVRTDKRYQRYNWGQRPLSPEALRYAALDTHYLIPLRDRQMEELRRAGRLEQAAEAFARLTQVRACRTPFGPEAFWRIRNVHTLTPAERAILWRLYLWRDEIARERDVPPFRVVTNEVLVALARSRPRTLEELIAQGFPRSMAQRYGRIVLDLIWRGKDVPPLPGICSTDRDVAARYHALRAWRRRVAEQRGADPDTILPRSVLWTLAERNPATWADLEAIPELGAWEREAWGPEILAVLRDLAGVASDS